MTYEDDTRALYKALSSIEEIATVMPGVAKRSDLKVIAEEIFRHINEARRHGSALEKEIINLKYDWPNDRFKRVKGVKRG
jgi:hypothetical protein